jgi:hypothetical protein
MMLRLGCGQSPMARRMATRCMRGRALARSSWKDTRPSNNARPPKQGPRTC